MKPIEAEEHLRVIRSLMERATIYRAISAPTALVGGLTSVLVGALLHFYFDIDGPAWATASKTFKEAVFFGSWGAVLLATGAANVVFLAQEARRRGGSF